MTRHRLTYGSLMIVAIVALLAGDWKLEQSRYFGLLPAGANGALFAAFTVLLAIWGSFELYRMARAKGLHPLCWPGAISAAALAVSPFVMRLMPGRLAMLPVWVLVGAVMLVFLAQAASRRTANAIPNIAATLMGVCYLGGLAMFVVWIRLDAATTGLLLFLAVVKFTDIGAWAVGSAFGRHKMIPWLSPGKSWEGLAGGVAAAVLMSLGIGLASGMLGVWQAVAFGLVMAPVGQAGDLAESLLKRDSGLKDSGSIIPSFGGLLDILDSPLGAAPVGYLLLMLLR